MNYKKKLRVYIRQYSRKLQNKMTPVHQLSETQLLAVAVIRKAIINPNAELLIAPISGTRYIHFKEIFIRIENNFVNIINGSYSYHIDLDDKTINTLHRKFNAKLESTSKQWEYTITNKTKRSLNSILTELNKK